ncbi:MAG: hypothetical protein U5J98_09825 [Halobacteriales archaeon]|nr:hypothetical protein [Halobacteriales archaeon]
MGRYGDLDYARLTKGGVAIGVALFLIGAGGEWAIHSWLTGAPTWEDALFFDLEVIGILLFAVSPFLFGIFLPLTE